MPYPDEAVTATPDPLVARGGFLRGLCPLGDGLFAAGSAPLTITLHDIDSMKSIQRICLDDDPHHAVHSIAPWPFAAQK